MSYSKIPDFLNLRSMIKTRDVEKKFKWYISALVNYDNIDDIYLVTKNVKV